jgi:hypothetical protein
MAYTLQSSEKTFLHNVLVSFSNLFRERSIKGAPDCIVNIGIPRGNDIHGSIRAKDSSSRVEFSIYASIWHREDGFIHIRIAADSMIKDITFAHDVDYVEIAKGIVDTFAKMMNYKEE